MTPLMSYLTGFGLAGGVGTKAFIPVVLLGAFHYSPYFELSERWLWIASPPVMIVLGVMALVEIVVDSSPELGEYADAIGYLPKLAAGFIAFAAATGTVDSSLLELSASGLLGSGTAVGVHWLRNKVRRPMRWLSADVHTGFGRLVSVGEAGVATTVAGSAVLAPVVAVLLLSIAVGAALAIAWMIDRRRVPCRHCGQQIRPGAVICLHCGQHQTEEPGSASLASG